MASLAVKDDEKEVQRVECSLDSLRKVRHNRNRLVNIPM